MHGVEHILSLFFNNVSKTPILNEMITSHMAIYNLFGSVIYYKPHYTFKSKSYEFHNRNIGLFSGNDTRISGYFIGMHNGLRMRKAFLSKVSST